MISDTPILSSVSSGIELVPIRNAANVVDELVRPVLIRKIGSLREKSNRVLSCAVCCVQPIIGLSSHRISILGSETNSPTCTSKRFGRLEKNFVCQLIA